MSLPLYARIQQDLETRILSGEWAPGTRLPTEAELQQRYAVSRLTVQRTLRELVQAGLVVRYPRRGTFVAQTATDENLLHLATLSTEPPLLAGRHVVLEASVVPAGEAVLPVPELGIGVPVHQLRRLRLDRAGGPVAYEVSIVPWEVAPHLAENDLETLTTVAYLHSLGLAFDRSRVYVEPAQLAPDEARHLAQKAGALAFRLRRQTWLEGGRLAESNATLLPPDSSRFFIEQKVARSGRRR